MEEPEEKLGLMSKIRGLFSVNSNDFDEEEMEFEPAKRYKPAQKVSNGQLYHVAVRKELCSVEEAKIAADGLKEGTQQIINLTMTPPELRQRIIDFLDGVVYALNGRLEKISDNVFLFAPRQAVVDIAVSSTRFHDELN